MIQVGVLSDVNITIKLMRYLATLFRSQGAQHDLDTKKK